MTSVIIACRFDVLLMNFLLHDRIKFIFSAILRWKMIIYKILPIFVDLSTSDTPATFQINKFTNARVLLLRSKISHCARLVDFSTCHVFPILVSYQFCFWRLVNNLIILSRPRSRKRWNEKQFNQSDNRMLSVSFWSPNQSLSWSLFFDDRKRNLIVLVSSPRKPKPRPLCSLCFFGAAYPELYQSFWAIALQQSICRLFCQHLSTHEVVSVLVWLDLLFSKSARSHRYTSSHLRLLVGSVASMSSTSLSTSQLGLSSSASQPGST